jgi:hypothetical protein
MRRGLRGYASGGFVGALGGTAPAAAGGSAAALAGALTFAPSFAVDLRGSNLSPADVDDKLGKFADDMKKQLPSLFAAFLERHWRR